MITATCILKLTTRQIRKVSHDRTTPKEIQDEDNIKRTKIMAIAKDQENVTIKINNV